MLLASRQSTNSECRLSYSILMLSILVPEPRNIATSDVKESSTLLSWTIPDSPLTLQNVELELNATDGSSSITMLLPPDLNGTKLLTDLISGTSYSVRLRSIASDGRTSDFSTPSHVFVTGKKNSIGFCC